MNELLSSLFLGLLSTAFLFIISLFLTIGAKTVFNKFFYREKVENPSSTQKKVKRTRKTPNKNSPSVVRSIEIDPSTVDRIYVKKAQ